MRLLFAIMFFFAFTFANADEIQHHRLKCFLYSTNDEKLADMKKVYIDIKHTNNELISVSCNEIGLDYVFSQNNNKTYIINNKAVNEKFWLIQIFKKPYSMVYYRPIEKTAEMDSQLPVPGVIHLLREGTPSKTEAVFRLVTIEVFDSSQKKWKIIELPTMKTYREDWLYNLLLKFGGSHNISAGSED